MHKQHRHMCVFQSHLILKSQAHSSWMEICGIGTWDMPVLEPSIRWQAKIWQGVSSSVLSTPVYVGNALSPRQPSYPFPSMHNLWLPTHFTRYTVMLGSCQLSH